MKKQTGFTLIELLITVAVVGILAAIAYPSYTEYMVRLNRAAAVNFILVVASKQEQYNLNARQYTADLAMLATTPVELSSKYIVNVVADNSATPPTYTITAAPTGSQLSRDAKCLNLSIDQVGFRNISGTGTVAGCW